MKKAKGSFFVLFSKYLLITATVFSASVIVGVMLFSAVRDVLALGKSRQKTATVTVDQIKELAGALNDSDIIEHPLLFSAYVTLSDPPPLCNGTVTVNASMDYRALLRAFTSPPPPKVVTVSFPEGSTTDQIIDILIKQGIGTREGFMETINSYPFEYDFIESLNEKASGDRKYRLDGYLYPDTYDFYTGRSEAYYIYKMLDRFCQVAAEIGVDLIDDDTLIIASMIQSSTESVAQFEYMSAVFHNRLKNPGDYPYLQCPATSAYAMGIYGVTPGIPGEEIKNADTPYNTFKNKGLPPGAVCNPSKYAMIAALYPANCNYKYFYTDQKGEAVFTSTLKQHEINLSRADQ